MLNNMKIGTRLYFGFGIIVALLLILWGVGKWGMSSMNSAMTSALKGVSGDNEARKVGA